MTLENRVVSAKNSKSMRNEIIAEYINFILSQASKTLKRHVTVDDDVFSVAMIAFDEAIINFNSRKGSFLSFASWVIKNRIIDHMRKESKHLKSLPFSSLSYDDTEGEEFTFDTEDRKHALTDIALEVRFLTHELEKYGISLEDVGKSAPVFSVTRRECSKLIEYIMKNKDLSEHIKTKKTIPVKRLIGETNVSEKLLERHRKYIIASVIILSGEYEYIVKFL